MYQGAKLWLLLSQLHQNFEMNQKHRRALFGLGNVLITLMSAGNIKSTNLLESVLSKYIVNNNSISQLWSPEPQRCAAANQLQSRNTMLSLIDKMHYTSSISGKKIFHQGFSDL